MPKITMRFEGGRELAAALQVEVQFVPVRTSAADALAALVPGALVERIAGAGHLANLEQPERFNAMIDRFLLEIDNNSNG